MSEAFNGTVTVAQNDGDVTITLDGRHGNVTLGGNGSDGDITIKDGTGANRMVMNGDGSSFVIRNADGNVIVNLGSNGNLVLGGTGMDGDLTLKDDANNSTITMNGQEGNVTLGGNGKDGDIWLRDSDGNNAIHIDGNQANMFLGGNGRDGDIALFAASETNPADDASKATIHLNGDAGDIILRNADCAEEFTVAASQDASPGNVMVLGPEGLLVPCDTPFDKRAVGVVSGADLYKPGIVLDRQDDVENRHPIALMGKVCVRVSDENGPIEIGDLLTTASKTGHAMAAGNDPRAFGSVIGKALQRHESGDGMIAIVISLQ
ncbi:MAG: hypothetical protein AAF439_08580 [Pseudomonadota bacterium]